MSLFTLSKPVGSHLGHAASYYRPDPLFKDLNDLVDSALNITSDFYSHKLTLSEDDINYYLSVDLPGYKNGEIDISVENSVLSITANNSTRGKVSRSLSLWSGLDDEKITGKVEDGVLTVTLPKVEKVKPKKIKVE